MQWFRKLFRQGFLILGKMFYENPGTYNRKGRAKLVETGVGSLGPTPFCGSLELILEAQRKQLGHCWSIVSQQL